MTNDFHTIHYVIATILTFLSACIMLMLVGQHVQMFWMRKKFEELTEHVRTAVLDAYAARVYASNAFNNSKEILRKEDQLMSQNDELKASFEASISRLEKAHADEKAKNAAILQLVADLALKVSQQGSLNADDVKVFTDRIDAVTNEEVAQVAADVAVLPAEPVVEPPAPEVPAA